VTVAVAVLWRGRTVMRQVSINSVATDRSGTGMRIAASHRPAAPRVRVAPTESVKAATPAQRAIAGSMSGTYR